MVLPTGTVRILDNEDSKDRMKSMELGLGMNGGLFEPGGGGGGGGGEGMGVEIKNL